MEITKESYRKITKQKIVKSKNAIIGRCPWCTSPIIKHEQENTSCIVCSGLISWDIEEA